MLPSLSQNYGFAQSGKTAAAQSPRHRDHVGGRTDDLSCQAWEEAGGPAGVRNPGHGQTSTVLQLTELTCGILDCGHLRLASSLVASTWGYAPIPTSERGSITNRSVSIWQSGMFANALLQSRPSSADPEPNRESQHHHTALCGRVDVPPKAATVGCWLLPWAASGPPQTIEHAHHLIDFLRLERLRRARSHSDSRS